MHVLAPGSEHTTSESHRIWETNPRRAGSPRERRREVRDPIQPNDPSYQTISIHVSIVPVKDGSRPSCGDRVERRHPTLTLVRAGPRESRMSRASPTTAPCRVLIADDRNGLPRPWLLRAMSAVLPRRAPKKSVWVPAAPSYLSYQLRIR